MKVLVYSNTNDTRYLYWGRLSCRIENGGYISVYPDFGTGIYYETDEDIIIPGEFL